MHTHPVLTPLVLILILLPATIPFPPPLPPHFLGYLILFSSQDSYDNTSPTSATTPTSSTPTSSTSPTSSTPTERVKKKYRNNPVDQNSPVKSKPTAELASLSPLDRKFNHALNSEVLKLSDCFQTAPFSSTTSFLPLLSLYSQYVEDFNHINYSTIFSRLGRIRSSTTQRALLAHPTFHFLQHSLSTQFQTNLEAYDCRTISNVLHALAKLRTPVPAIINPVIADANYFIANAEPQHIANACWALAKMGYDRELCMPFFMLVDEHAEKIMDHGTTQEISSIAWSFATMRTGGGGKLFAMMESRASWIVENSGTQTIANILWAFARVNLDLSLNIPHPTKFIAAVDARAEWFVNNAKPQEISNAAWACAKLDTHAANLFQNITRVQDRFLDKSKSVEVGAAAWAFANLAVPGAFTFVDAVNRRASQIGTKTRSSRELALIAYSLAKYPLVNSRNFFGILGNRADFILASSFSPQVPCDIMWSFQVLRFFSRAFFEAVDAKSAWIASDGHSQNIVNVALAFAELNYQPTHIFEALAKDADGFIAKAQRSNSPQAHVCNVCWSIAILGLVKSNAGLVTALWVHLTSSNIHPKLSYADFSRMTQIELYAKVESVELKPMPEQLLARMQPEMLRNKRSKQSSKYTEDYADMLTTKFGFSHTRDVMAIADDPNFEHFLPIDIACTERKIAAVYYGKVRFTSEVGLDYDTYLKREPRMTGPTAAKKRLLEYLGWTVVELSWPTVLQRRAGEKEGGGGGSQVHMVEQFAKKGIVLSEKS